MNLPKFRNSLFYIKWVCNETAKLLGWIVIFCNITILGKYTLLKDWWGAIAFSLFILIVIITFVLDYYEYRKKLQSSEEEK